MKSAVQVVLCMCTIVVMGWSKGDLTRSLQLGETITLHCPVNTKGRDLSVSSVTWYKDGKVFYKFQGPASDYSVTTYPVNGVKLKATSGENGTIIVMGPVEYQTAGHYTCVTKLCHPHYPGLRLSLNVEIDLKFCVNKYCRN